MLDTLPYLYPGDFPPLTRRSVTTLQVNLGYRCNQQCLHCHVNAGPNRKEIMSSQTIEIIKQFVREKRPQTLDLTGGAPELHPQFCELTEFARNLGVKVIDRCNLTVLFEPELDDLAGFLARNQVEVIASLPCYLEENVDRQRGKGVFNKSIEAIRLLNQMGYALDDNLILNLVYNPQGADLPPSQGELQRQYKALLKERYDIVFNELYTITNMPIKRFGSTLISKNSLQDYMSLLKNAYDEGNHTQVMCRDMLSVDWQGIVYDCDFNQMLDLNYAGNASPVYLSQILDGSVNTCNIHVADHCYGCTAGQGSSCGGAL